MENVRRAAGVMASVIAVSMQVWAVLPDRPAAPPCAGFVAVAADQRGTVGRSAELGGATVTLEFVETPGGIHGFARGQGADQVWLDWSSTGGDGWARCDTPTAAQPATDDPMSLLRACGRVDDVVRCTDWF